MRVVLKGLMSNLSSNLNRASNSYMSGFRAVQAPSRADNKRGDKEGALCNPYLNMLRLDID